MASRGLLLPSKAQGGIADCGFHASKIEAAIGVVPTREELKVKRRTENTTIIVARLISMSLVLAASVAALPYRADAQESQRSQHATSAEEVVQQFYDWYLHARFPQLKRQNMAKFRKYVTQSFLKRAMAPDVDAVLFIDAQDNDSTWADNFSVSKATILGQQATVQVNLNGKEMKYKLLVTLRRENGVWKIDNVKGSD